MNEYYQENRKSILLLTSLFFVLAIVLYFILLRPLMTDLSNRERAVIEISNEVNLLEQKISTLEITSQEIDYEQLILENRIPKKQDLEQYILSLQRLEFLTDSLIESIDFVYDSNLDVPDDDFIEIEEVEVDPEVLDETDDAEVVEQDGVVIDPAILNEKPEELEVMTVRLNAISPDYKDFIKLLELIENEDRISIVTSLSFSKPTEHELFFAEDPSKVIPFVAELTTFYYVD